MKESIDKRLAADIEEEGDNLDETKLRQWLSGWQRSVFGLFGTAEGNVNAVVPCVTCISQCAPINPDILYFELRAAILFPVLRANK